MKREDDDYFKIGDTMYRIIEYRIKEDDNMMKGFGAGRFLTLEWTGLFWLDAPVNIHFTNKTFNIRAKGEKTFTVKADNQEAAFDGIRNKLDADGWELDYMEEV